MDTVSSMGASAKDSLKSYVERYERLEEEIQALRDDQKEVMGGAKAEGFDTKIIRQIIKIRKMEQAERQEQEALLDVYLQAMDMI